MDIITLNLVYVNKKHAIACKIFFNMSTFGQNLKAARKNNKISQKDFAERLNTTQQRVSEWECDKVEPSLFNIMKILKVLNVTFEELTDEIELQE